MNAGYFASCAQYMLNNKSNHKYIILKKKIYDTYELFTDETDTAYDEKITQVFCFQEETKFCDCQ